MSKSFLLRLSPELFKTIKQRAADMNQSINSCCAQLLHEALNSSSQSHENSALLKLLKNLFGKDLKGLVLFGSNARNTSTASSDIDLLVVLKKDIAISPSLYKKWDHALENEVILQALGPKLSPHFTHLPPDTKTPGSLWLEVALEGKIIWEEKKDIEETLSKIRKQIADGCFLRSYSYGVPYWKKVS